MRFTILFLASLFLTPNLYLIEDADAGVLIPRPVQSSFRAKSRLSTVNLKSLPQGIKGGGLMEREKL